MASNELIIDDDYCKAMGEYCQTQGKELDKIIKDYIKILQEVKDKGITSGEVSNALNVYISYVRRLDGIIEGLSSPIKGEVTRFLSKVDEKDKYLF